MIPPTGLAALVVAGIRDGQLHPFSYLPLNGGFYTVPLSLFKRVAAWCSSLARYWPMFMTRARYHQIGDDNTRLQGELDRAVQAKAALQKRLDDILFLPPLPRLPEFTLRSMKDPRDKRLQIAVDFSSCLIDETLATGGYGKLVELIALKVCDAMQAEFAPEGFRPSAYLRRCTA